MSTPAAAAADARTVYFAHDDERYLLPHQHQGAAALLPPAAARQEAVPLVVFLHGTNPSGTLHLWFGGGGKDLRPSVEHLVAKQVVRPFVLAAPSQTKGAAFARTTWQDFNLGAFVEDVVGATSNLVQIDRQNVILVGHSAAGCNPSGGLAADLAASVPALFVTLVSIDPCLDRELGEAFGRRPATIPLLLYYQTAVWTRSPEQFVAGLAQEKPNEREDRLVELRATGPNPHDAIVPVALQRALRELLPPPEPEPDEQDAPTLTAAQR